MSADPREAAREIVNREMEGVCIKALTWGLGSRPVIGVHDREMETLRYAIRLMFYRLEAYHAALSIETPRRDGPGSPSWRLTRLLDELKKRFPEAHNPIMSDPPEPKYLAAIDRALFPERTPVLSVGEAETIYRWLVSDPRRFPPEVARAIESWYSATAFNGLVSAPPQCRQRGRSSDGFDG